MLAKIERERESAVRFYSDRLDGWVPDSFVVSSDDIARATAAVPEELKQHIDVALGRIRAFAQAQRATLTDLEIEIAPGTVLGHRHIPVSRVGAYVPGGVYQLFASSFMTIAVAKEAGVPSVTGAAPPFKGDLMGPLMLHALARSGADAILCLGGVQAIASLAFGLFGLEPADMLVGAGNAYVAEAKRQLYGRVGIDLVAGPTEVLVIADESADARLVAVDLLAQAEHGPTSSAILVTTSEQLARDVLTQTEVLLETDWPTPEITTVSWREYGGVILADSDDDAATVANDLAAEHVELQVAPERQAWYEAQLRNYGSIFVGEDSTVAFGDKGVGTNHVLPTGRSARFTGGLWVGSFLKLATFQRITPDGVRSIAPTVSAIATAEGMLGHALSADMRLERPLATIARSDDS